MLGTGSWGKELGGGSIDIDLNLSEWKLGGGVGSGAASMECVWRLPDTETSGQCGALVGELYPCHEKQAKIRSNDWK